MARIKIALPAFGNDTAKRAAARRNDFSVFRNSLGSMDAHRPPRGHGFGGRIDLLAIAPDRALILIELKRGRTPREVVAQAIDYATWLETLDAEKVAHIYDRFAPGHDLLTDFRARFNHELDENSINESHEIVVVASSLDASSERIVGYLNKRNIPIKYCAFKFLIQVPSSY